MPKNYRSLFCLLLMVFISSGLHSEEKLDSMLNVIRLLHTDQSEEGLRIKAETCSEISAWYNVKFSNQDYSRTYLLQSIDYTKKLISHTKGSNPKDYVFLSDRYQEIAIFEAFRGDLPKSREYMEQYEFFLKGLKRIVSPYEYANSLIAFNRAYYALNFAFGDLNTAEICARKAYEIALQNPGLEEFQIHTLADISACCTRLGKTEEGIETAKKALDLFHQKPIEGISKCRFIFFLFFAYSGSEQYEKGISFLESTDPFTSFERMEAYLMDMEEMATRTFFELIFRTGQAKRKLFEEKQDIEQLKSSYDWLVKGFDLAEKRILKDNGDQIGNALLLPKKKLSNLFATSSMLEENGVFEREKVIDIIRILDVYHASRLHLERISYAVNASYWSREKELKNQIAFINTQIKEFGDNPNYKSQTDSLGEVLNQASENLIEARKYSKREKVLEEYRIDKGDYESSVQTHLLNSKKTILTYFYDPLSTAVYIAGMNTDTAFFKKVIVPDTFGIEIEKTYDLNAAIQLEESKVAAQDSCNRNLYELLIAPIQGCLTTDLLIYPINEMSYVSFEALLDGQNEYLIKSHSFQYTSSLFSIVSATQKKISEKNVLSFYPENYGSDSLSYLLNAKVEIEEMEKILNAKTFKGDLATKQRFLEIASGNKLIHIASHSVLDNEHPYESYILFNQTSDSSENQLFAYEVFSLTTEAELITLSSCNSGKGKIEEGIGAVSLSNAFYFAGVPATISSLWNAQDKSASEVMRRFYSGMGEGNSKSVSLREAKLGYLESADKIKKQPFFWANYVIYGEDDALFEKPKSWINNLLGYGMLTILIVVGFFHFRRLQKNKK